MLAGERGQGAVIEYQTGDRLDPRQVSDLYAASTLGERRPSADLEKMASMLRHANLVVTAWHEQRLVGIARSFSDFCYITYLADLAVDRQYQRRGIGKELIRRTRELGGAETNLFLAAAPASVDYYPRVGFQRHPSAWWLYPSDELGS